MQDTNEHLIKIVAKEASTRESGFSVELTIVVILQFMPIHGRASGTKPRAPGWYKICTSVASNSLIQYTEYISRLLNFIR